MREALHIRRLADLAPGIEALRAEAVSECFRFMDRLITEWRANTNRFDRAGEVLFGVYQAADLLAVEDTFRVLEQLPDQNGGRQ